MIQFCAIRDRETGYVLCSEENQWGHGSTMTGPLISTDFIFCCITSITGAHSGNTKFIMFESASAAQRWIEMESKRKLSKINRDNLEIVTFAELDAIVEKHLLDEE